MKTVKVQGTDLSYAESDVIDFTEGLIGMPHLRRMVLIHQTDIAPFLWLVSLDDPETAFVVLDPGSLYQEFTLPELQSVRQKFGTSDSATLLTLAIVTISSDWSKSTINLRAPILISPATMQGMQLILTESDYRHNESLPLASAA